MAKTAALVYRGSLVESNHAADIAVVDAKGRLLFAYGDPTRVSYLRSSAKPLQALPLVETGGADRFGLGPEEIAITCASHNGEPIHQEVVLQLLEKVGVDPTALQCGAHLPKDEATARELLASGQKEWPLHSNCSGKHAGMLALAKHLGVDVQGYMDINHPVQEYMRQSVAEMADLSPQELVIGTDGCGVPVFGMSVFHMAYAFARLANADELSDDRKKAALRVTEAMTRYPYLVAGRNRFDTDFMQVLSGQVVAKGGAEGVHTFGVIGKNIGVAMKIDDGQGRATAPIAIEILRQLALIKPEELHQLEAWREPIIRNFAGKVVGNIKAEFLLDEPVRST